MTDVICQTLDHSIIMRNTLEMFSTSIDIYRSISLFSVLQVINRACEVKSAAVILFCVVNLVIIVCHETEVMCYIQTFLFLCDGQVNW